MAYLALPWSALNRLPTLKNAALAEVKRRFSKYRVFFIKNVTIINVWKYDLKNTSKIVSFGCILDSPGTLEIEPHAPVCLRGRFGFILKPFWTSKWTIVGKISRKIRGLRSIFGRKRRFLPGLMPVCFCVF